jgi:hypothetical protein
VRTAEQLIKSTVGCAFFHICSSGEQIAAARNTQSLRGGSGGARNSNASHENGRVMHLGGGRRDLFNLCRRDAVWHAERGE